MLDDLKTFTVVVSTGSFTGAAESLGLSKSYVSRRVRALERELGVQLLTRTTRSLSLTSAGAVLYKSGSAAFEQIKDATSQILELQSEPRGHIRISAPNGYGQAHLAPLFATFLLKHPGVHLQVEYADRFVDVVEEGFDLVIRIGHLQDSSLSAQKMGESTLHVAASPTYWRQHKKPARPEGLKDLPCILYQRQLKPREWHFSHKGQMVSVPVHGRLITDSGHAMVQSAIHGLGIVNLPDFLIRDALRSGELVEVLKSWKQQPRGIWLLRPERRYAPRRVEALIEALLSGTRGQHPQKRKAPTNTQAAGP